MTLPEQYAHDYRDMKMSEEELQKMLEEFEAEVRREERTRIAKYVQKNVIVLCEKICVLASPLLGTIEINGTPNP